jgi:hypothetical protein
MAKLVSVVACLANVRICHWFRTEPTSAAGSAAYPINGQKIKRFHDMILVLLNHCVFKFVIRWGRSGDGMPELQACFPTNLPSRGNPSYFLFLHLIEQSECSGWKDTHGYGWSV